MSTYKYRGYTIKNLGYHQPDHNVIWEATDANGAAAFHGYSLREVESRIDDSFWEDKVRALENELRSEKRKNKNINDMLDEVEGLIDRAQGALVMLRRKLSASAPPAPPGTSQPFTPSTFQP